MALRIGNLIYSEKIAELCRGKKSFSREELLQCFGDGSVGEEEQLYWDRVGVVEGCGVGRTAL